MFHHPCLSGAQRPVRRSAVATGLVAFTASLSAATPVAAAPTWLKPVDLPAASAFPASSPDVAITWDDAVAVWVQSDGADARIRTATRPAGKSWPSTAETLSIAGEPARDPEVRTNARGDAIAIWTKSDGTSWRTQVAQRSAGGAWSAPVTLSARGRSASAAHVVIDGAGNADAVWLRSDGSHQRVEAARLVAGGTWQAPVVLSTAGQDAAAPQVAVGSQGVVRAVWSRDLAGDPSASTIESATHTRSGTWGATQNLGRGEDDLTGGPAAPVVVVDAASASTVAWNRARVLVAAHRPAGGSWSAPVALLEDDSAGPVVQVGTSGRGDIAVDPAGAVTVTWSEQYSDDPSRYDFNVIAVARRSTQSGAWTTTTTPGSKGSGFCSAFDLDPRVAASKGPATVVWNAYAYCLPDRPETANPALYAIRSLAGPVAPVESNLDPATGDSVREASAVASDARGNATAVWVDRADPTHVQAAGFDATGPRFLSLSVPEAGTRVRGRSGVFAVSVPYDVFSGIASTTWAFGDGTTAAGKAVRHTYAEPGTYTVTVTSVDGLGNSTSASRSVTVS